MSLPHMAFPSCLNENTHVAATLDFCVYKWGTFQILKQSHSYKEVAKMAQQKNFFLKSLENNFHTHSLFPTNKDNLLHNHNKLSKLAKEH